MRKIIISIAIFLSIITLFSCDNNDYVPVSTKEKIDHINDNFFFEDESIKLCYEHPELLDRNYDDEIYINNGTTRTYLKYDREKYGLPYDEIPDAEKPKSILWSIKIGINSAAFENDDRIVEVSSLVDNFKLFGLGFGDSYNELRDKLYECGFVLTSDYYKTKEIENGSLKHGYIFQYGSLQIDILTFTNKICSINVKVFAELNKTTIEKTVLKDLPVTKENLIKYVFPYGEIKDFKLRVQCNIDVYTDEKTIKYHPVEDLYSVTVNLYNIINDEGKPKDTRVINKYIHVFCTDQTLRYQIPVEKYNDQDYLSTLDVIYDVRYGFKISYYVPGINGLDVRGALDKYLYFDELIRNDPLYIEYWNEQASRYQ